MGQATGPALPKFRISLESLEGNTAADLHALGLRAIREAAIGARNVEILRGRGQDAVGFGVAHAALVRSSRPRTRDVEHLEGEVQLAARVFSQRNDLADTSVRIVMRWQVIAVVRKERHAGAEPRAIDGTGLEHAGNGRARNGDAFVAVRLAARHAGDGRKLPEI